FNADGTTVKRLLNADTTGPSAPAEAFNHGNHLEVALKGVGADRKLFGIDEDKDAGATKVTQDFLRWDVSNVLEDYTGQPIELLNGGSQIPLPQLGAGTRTNFYTGRGLYIGQLSGDAYICNRRFNNSLGNLAFFRADLDAEGNVAGTVWV
ncbi:MAG: hypothetical protein GX616_19905, partial [Planctomycetes bacterium]|nr:hypothetical protein [Planctomycetota bacterium]